jgi:transposase
LDCAVDDDRLKRYDLSDTEWARLEPLLPAHPRQGHRWNDHRLVIDGILFRTRAGGPWRDLPERPTGISAESEASEATAQPSRLRILA